MAYQARPAKLITLNLPIAESGLCTPVYAKTLEDVLGLVTIGDLLVHYPRRYEDRTRFLPVSEVAGGQSVTICGAVTSVKSVTTRSRLTIVKVTIDDGSGVATLVFYNQWFVKKQFDGYIGRRVVAYGKAVKTGSRTELSEVEWELIEGGEDSDTPDTGIASIHSGRIVPIYPLAEGVKQQRLRRLIWEAISALPHQPETLPEITVLTRLLVDRDTAVRNVHFPGSVDILGRAKYRLAYEGLFRLQLALAVSKRNAKAENGISFSNRAQAIIELLDMLPFRLTDAQNHAIAEIAADMESTSPMNRLLQGDVGSGKTVVAMAALLMAVRSGYQAAIMAPTEILAEQHFRSIAAVMDELGVPTLLLTGSSHKPKAKTEAQEAVAAGVYSVVVGTHALIQSGLKFQRLGLVVIDEQHRFGVMQRATLRQKGLDSAGLPPDVLVMTATPIPRTLTLTLYGDLDVTIIDELPPGRKPIKTHWKYAESRPSVYDAVRNLVAQGHQVYVICALVNESEKLQARAATVLADHLSTEVFPDFKIGLLHGQMKPDEKDAAMLAFRKHETQILVSTTVIEVGVDVPNASVMVIEDADRFGLAQLHQLRGRVGRGTAQSYCILIADPKSTGVSERLAVLERCTDGFEIAEADLEMRGPGEFFGTKQSGAEIVPFADLCSIDLIEQVRDDAAILLDRDPDLLDPAHAVLRTLVDESIAQRQALAMSN